MSDATRSNLTLRDLFQLGQQATDAAADGTSPRFDDLVSVEVKDAAIEPDVLLDGVLSQLGSLLDVEIAEILATAWSKAKQLQEYRDPTRHPPDELSTVSLVEHTVESRYQPAIELLVNGKSLQRLGVDVGVELAIQALDLEIQRGRIMALRPGRCQATGRVLVQGHPLAELATREVTLPGRKALGEGVEIPDLDEATDSAEPSGDGDDGISPATRPEAGPGGP